MAVSEGNVREWTTIPKDLSKQIKNDAEKHGRGSKSKQIAYILKLYYKYQDIIEKIHNTK